MTQKLCLSMLMVVIAWCQPAAARGSFTFPLQGVNLEIMNANPFLRNGVGGLPPLKTVKVVYYGVTHEEWKKPIKAVILNGCEGIGLSSGQATNCLDIPAWGAMSELEENYDKQRDYRCILYPNSPRIQQIFELHPKAKNIRLEKGEGLMRLIATVDEHGKITETSTLFKVGSDRRTLTEIHDGVAADGNATFGIGENRVGNNPTAQSGTNTPQAPNGQSVPQATNALDCASMAGWAEKAKCIANSAAAIGKQ